MKFPNRHGNTKFHWKITTAVLVVFAAGGLVFAGCAAGADYYGREEVVRYAQAVHGSGTAFVREETFRYADGGRAVQYIFKDSAGRKFTVSTEPVNNSTGMSSAQRGICDRYYDAIITDRMSRLQALIDDSGLDVRITQTGSTDVKDNRTWKIAMYLDRTDDFGAASMLISKIDAELAYRCDRTSSEIGRGQPDEKSITVYMQPDRPGDGDTAENWKESAHLSDYRISAVAFTNGGDRMSASQADLEIENDFVDTVKLQSLRGESFYEISDTLSEKYSAPVLNVTSVQGHHPDNGDYVFYYDRDSGQYWMTNLDLCQDFDGFPYTYEGRGSFAQLVKWLGGDYSCENWKARWSIGHYSWSASLSVRKTASSSYAYKNMRIARGDTYLSLSEPASDIPGGGRNQTPSGRAFSIEDLVRMLHANITVNEDTMTAMIYN